MIRKQLLSVLNWLTIKIKQSEPKIPKPELIKMYVLVRMDLPPIHRAVQAGHAVAEYFMRDLPKQAINKNGELVNWYNGYIIYLGISDENELNKWKCELDSMEKKFATFLEPDWGVPQETALACISFGHEFEALPLLTL